MAHPAGKISTAFSAGYAKAAGFTLVEIIIVIAIVAILTAISVPVYNTYVDKAKVTLAVSALEATRKALENYHIDYQHYPLTINFATGKDEHGGIVLPEFLLESFHRGISSVDSYTPTAMNYTLLTHARDANHSLLVLTPNQVVIQGP